ncbi:hypothetical protein [Dactylosporangium aurantiacum]|nr:hypothetical protein [Dactylosporangium aurantiacum]MDG6106450.1 hypothetical protein [Dactylosporangium aurantiacum]
MTIVERNVTHQSEGGEDPAPGVPDAGAPDGGFPGDGGTSG